jgi:cell fate (sporulation/competence/biofilm development) regulator YlbF (YheA/YmcA/DUF963 family)
MDGIWEKAQEVGRLVAQSDEYRAFRAASQRLGEDRDTVARLNRLQELEGTLARRLQEGVEPPEEERLEYERLLDEVQVLPAYQAMAAAQANFDRLMMRINEEMAKGIEAGEQSRIILAT